MDICFHFFLVPTYPRSEIVGPYNPYNSNYIFSSLKNHKTVSQNIYTINIQGFLFLYIFTSTFYFLNHRSIRMLYLKQISNKDLPYRELCPISCNNLNGKRTWKRIDTCICITESLCCTPETQPCFFRTVLLNTTAKSLQSCPTLCDPWTAAHRAPPSLGFSRKEHWSGLPFPSPVHESEKWKWSRSVMSDSQRPRGLQPTRFLHPWDFPGKSTGVGCYCLFWNFTSSYS